MLQIIDAPNEVLSQKAKEVSKIDKNLLDFIAEMKAALDQAVDPIGVGLAAPQVGKSLRLFITKPNPKKESYSVFINPNILTIDEVSNGVKKPKKKSKGKKLEGCLSLPNIWGEVKRSNEVEVEYKDEKGKSHRKKFKGFMATIIQHEVDHLNGVLFPKRVLEQKGTLYKSYKNEEGEDEFEEMKI